MQENQANISTPQAIEKATILDLLRQRFRLRAWRRIGWLRQVWQQSTPENEQLGAYHQEVDRILLQVDHPEAEQAWYQSSEAQQSLQEELEKIELLLAQDTSSRFFMLRQIFGLNEVEADLLQACLSLALEPALGRVCAYLQDQTNRFYITGELVARIYVHGTFLPISSESPLLSWRLIRKTDLQTGEPPAYSIDPYIRDWLRGISELDEKLVGCSALQFPQNPLPDWPVAEAVELFQNSLTAEPSSRLRMQVYGQAGSGRKTFAACVAQHLELPLLVIQADRVPPGLWEDLCIHAYRQAYLDRCALAWVGKSLSERSWPIHLPPFQVQFALCEEEQKVSDLANTKDCSIKLPELSLASTRDLWQQLLPQSKHWKADALERLWQKHHFTIGQIVELAELQVENIQQVEVHIKNKSQNRLGNLAQALAANFDWEDLVVKPELRQQLRDFVFEATARRDIWERPEMIRLFPQGRGLFALFTGVPGTGKTMAAQVIASELDLPLFRIDLSSVVSKYVGETSKNLQRILSRARQMNAVLLFDEADALFGKRTEIKDAHDRFANTDTNYLLQAIEQFPGIAILTSNKKTNIDHGFIRRLRYVLDFPKPDTKQRAEIWYRLLEEMLVEDNYKQLKDNVSVLAENLELTGAQIKLAILSASIMARREEEMVTEKHLLQGIEREWNKEGRGISQELRKVLLKESKPMLSGISQSDKINGRNTT